MSNGALFVPTLNRLDSKLCAIINNYNRPHYQVSGEDVGYKIKVFSGSKLIIEKEEEILKPQEFKRFDFDNLFNLDKNQEYLFCCDFSLKKTVDASFVREHQVIYKNAKNNKFGTVVFENLPKAGKAPATIICIAHKCFISDEINAIICLGIREPHGSDIASEAVLEYVLLDEKGNQASQNKVKVLTNSTYYIDIKKEEEKFLKSKSDKMRFYTLGLRVHNARCILYTALLNEKTGNMAIEHSLAPLYYTESKDLGEIRKTAISNFF